MGSGLGMGKAGGGLRREHLVRADAEHEANALDQKRPFFVGS
jgi:hypothetical protein